MDFRAETTVPEREGEWKERGGGGDAGEGWRMKDGGWREEGPTGLKGWDQAQRAALERSGVWGTPSPPAVSPEASPCGSGGESGGGARAGAAAGVRAQEVGWAGRPLPGAVLALILALGFSGTWWGCAWKNSVLLLSVSFLVRRVLAPGPWREGRGGGF